MLKLFKLVVILLFVGKGMKDVVEGLSKEGRAQKRERLETERDGEMEDRGTRE